MFWCFSALCFLKTAFYIFIYLNGGYILLFLTWKYFIWLQLIFVFIYFQLNSLLHFCSKFKVLLLANIYINKFQFAKLEKRCTFIWKVKLNYIALDISVMSAEFWISLYPYSIISLISLCSVYFYIKSIRFATLKNPDIIWFIMTMWWRTWYEISNYWYNSF